MATYKIAETERLDAALTEVANAIRSKVGGSATYQFPGSSSTYNGVANAITNNLAKKPSGTKTITANGTHDISTYAAVSVEVPVGYALVGTWEIDAAKLYSKCTAKSQTINFQAGTYAGGRPCTGIVCTSTGLYYVKDGSNVQVFSKYAYQNGGQYWFHENIDEDEDEVNIINFGTSPQTVSETFYLWFASVATVIGSSSGGGEGGGSSGSSVSTGTLNLSIDYSQGFYVPVLNNGSITYSALTGDQQTINNVVLNAPFTVLYGDGEPYPVYPPDLNNVTQLHSYVPADHNYCSFVGILTSSSGAVGIVVSCCFEGSSQVLLANGTTKALSTIEIGDTVLTYNETTKEIEANKVTALGTVKLTRIAQITLEDTTVIRMNRYHPMWTQDGWKSLTGHNGLPMLTANDKLMNNNGEYIAIKNIEIVDIEKETYYTLKVANNNNFYVNGYLAQGKDKD